MGITSLCFKFSVFISLSLAVSSSVHASFRPRAFSPSSTSTPKASSAPPVASATDLLSLLGSREQASTINGKEAEELWSCLRFLVPFSPNQTLEKHSSRRRELFSGYHNDRGGHCSKLITVRNRTDEDELVWLPPAPVLELARLAVDSGGDAAAIHRALDPTMLPVPDVEGSVEDRCQLTRTPYGRRFINEELNLYLAFLFEIIAARGPSVGLNVSLNRYDFFHGHLFIAKDSGRLGILFHAKEYPACDKEVFPYNLGYCQIGSNVIYDDSMNLRNILWLAPLPNNSTQAWVSPGILVVLDAHPGGIIYKDLIRDYVKVARTMYEDDLGQHVVDVNYLNVGHGVSDFQNGNYIGHLLCEIFPTEQRPDELRKNIYLEEQNQRRILLNQYDLVKFI